MLRISLTICALLMLQLTIFGQGGALTIKGKIKDPKGSTAAVFYNLSPLTYEREVFKAEVDKSGNFSMTIDLDKARFANFSYGGERTSLYLNPNEEVTISLDPLKFDESIRYEGNGLTAKASNYLAAYFLRFEDEEPSKEYRQITREQNPGAVKEYIMAQLGEKMKFLSEQKEQLQLPLEFADMLKSKYSYQAYADLLELPDYRAYLEGMKASDVKLPEGYYDFLPKIEVNKPELVDVREYLSFLKGLIQYHYLQANDEKEEHTTEIKMALAKDLFKDEVYSLFMADNIISTLNYGSFADAELMWFAYKKMGEDLEEDEELPYQNIIEPLYEKIKPLAPGNEAPAFALKTKDDKEVKLEDFKGKVVYVDFWASWCGPCRREMPYARKMQQHFKGKDVVFVYISVDRSKKAWLKAMEEEQLPGVHIWAGGADTQVTKDYLIEGIPHYYLIDREGNIGNNNATRPSNDKTYREITGFLGDVQSGKK